MPVFSHHTLYRASLAILQAVGTLPESAHAVAESLIEANLAGHDSHGVIRLPWYVDFVRRGAVLPAALPSIIRRQGATALVDGGLGWGQPAARLAAQAAIELAASSGVGAVTIVNCNHIGRVGEYVEMIARAGMIGIACCNASQAVAPYGGAQRVMGTNPFAWAAPQGGGRAPLVLDFATSIVAEGKLRVARASGAAIPPGVIVNADGHPSLDAADFYNGGALQAFGLHKGSGLSLMIELLARGLAGVDPTLPEYGGFNGTVMLALDIATFAPFEQYSAAAERLCAEVERSRRLEGFDAVLLPGQAELRTRRQREETGIPLAPVTWAAILALAAEFDVPLPAGEVLFHDAGSHAEG